MIRLRRYHWGNTPRSKPVYTVENLCLPDSIRICIFPAKHDLWPPLVDLKTCPGKAVTFIYVRSVSAYTYHPVVSIISWRLVVPLPVNLERFHGWFSLPRNGYKHNMVSIIIYYIIKQITYFNGRKLINSGY